MSIWTSRYSNKQLQNEGYYPVGISIGKPRFRTGYVIKEQCYSLAPKGYMLHMEKEPYAKEYIKKLEDIGTEKIIQMIRRMDRVAKSVGEELVLLCFEDIRIPEDWCHRRLFADWWKEKTGEVIEELPDPTPPKAKKKSKDDGKKSVKESAKQDSGCKQMSLFDCGMARI